LRIVIGGDHWGYQLKGPLREHLEVLGHEVVDIGAHEHDPADDYPDFAMAVAERVAVGQADRGVVVCGSGVGACVAANKVLGVRASVCHDAYSAHQGVEHDDMNVLCLGSRIVGDEVARELVAVFVSAEFTGEERHRRRLDKVLAMEARWREGAPS
jgi:ribose 5-phosphate isomerase B